MWCISQLHGWLINLNVELLIINVLLENMLQQSVKQILYTVKLHKTEYVKNIDTQT